MRSGWIYLIIGIVLLGAAGYLAWPLLQGPHSLRTLRTESAQLDSVQADINEMADSLKVYTQLDSLTIDNVCKDNIN